MWPNDFTSCQSFRHTTEDIISIVLYQDEFEIANPLGSATGQFKLLGVYMTLGNLPLQYRSRVESLQMTILCRQKDVKEFGLEEVLQPLTHDLALLKKNEFISECG